MRELRLNLHAGEQEFSQNWLLIGATLQATGCVLCYVCVCLAVFEECMKLYCFEFLHQCLSVMEGGLPLQEMGLKCILTRAIL